MARPSSYPAELHECAVRMVAEIIHSHPTGWAVMKAVAADLGIEAAATAEWADWFNNQLLHTAIRNIPPHEHETNYYAPQRWAGLITVRLPAVDPALR